MPRYRSDRAYQVGDYWLSKQSRSEAWCRTWFDPKTRQTKRVSLRTADLEEAKQRLTDWFVLEQTKPEPEPTEEVTLAEVFARFYEQHGKTLKSAESTRIALRHWLDFHGDASIAQAAVQAVQERFHKHLSEKGLSAGSIRNTIAIGKSAINWARKRGEITEAPYFHSIKVPRPKPKGRPLDVSEVAHLFQTASDHHLRVFLALMLGTAARTSAVLGLSYAQIDIPIRLINLNPYGREQTNKYRPEVKLPEQLASFIQHGQKRSPNGPVVCFKGKPVTSIRTAWRTLRKQANFDDKVQTYSLRHTIARWLRMQGVPPWEVAAQLGHKMANYETTEIYAPFDPKYLVKSKSAIDLFLDQVACELRVSSMSEYLLESEAKQKNSGRYTGGLGRIRTPDPLIRSQVLYPTELPDLTSEGDT